MLTSFYSWKALPISTYKINWTIDKLTERIGLGALLRNHTGYPITAKSLTCGCKIRGSQYRPWFLNLFFWLIGSYQLKLLALSFWLCIAV